MRDHFEMLFRKHWMREETEAARRQQEDDKSALITLDCRLQRLIKQIFDQADL